tara:strand:+ start:475 stop:999 length:525 start_codon:yes stop_codon:yes gene_type:complete
MKYLIIILMALIIPTFVSVANAQTLYVDASYGDMDKIEESKYKATGLSEVRNANGELLSVIRVDASRYLDHPIVDEFLNSEPKNLVKQGSVNGQKINMYNIIAEYAYPECISELYDVPGYADSCNWYHRSFVSMLGVTDERNGERYNIFRGLNHAFIVTQLDEVKTFWTIFSRE